MAAGRMMGLQIDGHRHCEVSAFSNLPACLQQAGALCFRVIDGTNNH